ERVQLRGWCRRIEKARWAGAPPGGAVGREAAPAVGASAPTVVDNEELLRAYREHPSWNQFPVQPFDEREDLQELSIASELVMRKARQGADDGGAGPAPADATLEKLRYPGHTVTSVSATEILDVLDKKGATRVVIFGEAGDGKSTLLRVLANHF